MQLSEVVRRRRMVRAFTAEPVPWEAVERLLRTAQRAPSAGYSQGISFVVVTGDEGRRAIAGLAGKSWYTAAGHRPFISQAPVQIVVCAGEEVYRARYREPDKRKGDEGQRDWPVPWWYVDAGAALMLLLLAVVDEGLQGAFVGVRDPGALAAYLGIPPGTIPIGVVLVGHGAPDKPSRSLRRGRRSLPEVLHRERW